MGKSTNENIFYFQQGITKKACDTCEIPRMLEISLTDPSIRQEIDRKCDGNCGPYNVATDYI